MISAIAHRRFVDPAQEHTCRCGFEAPRALQPRMTLDIYGHLFLEGQEKADKL